MFQKIIKKTKYAILLALLTSMPSVAALQNQLYVNKITSNDINNNLNEIKTSHSLIIQDPSILAMIEAEHSFGQKLGELAYHQKIDRSGGDALGVSDTPSFIWRGFTASDGESTENNNLMANNQSNNYKEVPMIPYAQPGVKKTPDGVMATNIPSTAIGVNARTNITPYQHVINLWPEIKKADGGYRINGSKTERYNPNHVGKGPFRLLAIINRMDMSGNLPRGSGPTGYVDPRAFGEVHLIYGLVDKNYETMTRRAYPQTFQITYRLPPLDATFTPQKQERRNPSRGKISTHESFMIANGLSNWRVTNERWARLWRQLSRLDIKSQSQQFANHVHGILDRAATPDNFLNMNSNSAVGGYYDTKRKALYGTENELKAYYANQDIKTLLPTGLERDAYRCVVNTKFVRNIINGYLKTYPADGDFFKTAVTDIMSWNPSYDPSVSNYSGLNAYMLANNLSQGVTHPSLVNQLPGSIGPNSMPGCTNSDHGQTPYKLIEGKDTATVIPRIGRTGKNFAWEMPNKTGLPNVSEAGRHAFAIRSCSGCHGAETKTNGFHVENRLANSASKKSAFLGEKAMKTARLSGGKYYIYTEVQNRKDWLVRSVENNQSIKPGYGLVRKNDIAK